VTSGECAWEDEEFCMSEKAANIENTLVSSRQLAAIFGCDESRIRQLDGKVFSGIDQGPKKRIRTLYRLGDAVQAFIAHKVALVRNDSPLAVEMDAEKLLKLKSERAISEMKARAMSGELHRSEDVKMIITDRNARFRSRLLAIPTRLARTLIGQRDMPTIFRLLTEAVAEVLKELADYKAQDFHVRNPGYFEIENGNNKP
jgi:phage terminase Nu1 subunit (DNA packaging protein)